MVESVSGTNATIRQDSLLTSVSLDRLTMDLALPKIAPQAKFQLPPDSVPNLEDKPKFRVDRLVSHKEEPEEMYYLVRWYGCRADEDEYLPAVAIPPKFITCLLYTSPSPRDS